MAVCDHMVAGARPATMVAAADGGAWWGNEAEWEEEGGGVPKDGELTRSALEGTATAGEERRRRIGPRMVAAGGGEDSDGGGDCGYPATIPSA